MSMTDADLGFFSGKGAQIYNINRQEDIKKMKAEVTLRHFVHCLINLCYTVVGKYSYQIEVKSYEMFYPCKRV